MLSLVRVTLLAANRQRPSQLGTFRHTGVRQKDSPQA